MSDHCPQLEKLPENARKFWEDKQKELEDTLIRFSYTILLVPSQPFLVEKSGLLYLMKHNLWFEDFQKPPLFLFAKRASYKKTIIQIPLETLEECKVIPRSLIKEVLFGEKARSGFFQNLLRLLSPDPLYLHLSGKQASGASFHYAFRELDDPNSWQLSLSTLLETGK